MNKIKMKTFKKIIFKIIQINLMNNTIIAKFKFNKNKCNILKIKLYNNNHMNNNDFNEINQCK